MAMTPPDLWKIATLKGGVDAGEATAQAIAAPVASHLGFDPSLPHEVPMNLFRHASVAQSSVGISLDLQTVSGIDREPVGKFADLVACRV
jgi:hypothetical protein